MLNLEEIQPAVAKLWRAKGENKMLLKESCDWIAI